jgi:hypothetical protein
MESNFGMMIASVSRSGLTVTVMYQSTYPGAWAVILYVPPSSGSK